MAGSNDALRTLMLRLLFRRLTAESETPAPETQGSETDSRIRRATAEQRKAGAICRVCFEAGEEELIAPCACTGTQQWIHEQCLRQWQRSLQGQRDAGHRASRCSVCTTLFALPPPRLPTAPVQVGSLLVAGSLLGGSFKQGVVLICHADEHSVHGVLLTSPSTHRPCTPPDPNGPEAQARRTLARLHPGVDAEWFRGGPVCGGRLGVTTYSALHNMPTAPGSFLIVGPQRSGTPIRGSPTRGSPTRGSPSGSPTRGSPSGTPTRGSPSGSPTVRRLRGSPTAAPAPAPAPAPDAADAAIAGAAQAAQAADATADSILAAAAGGSAVVDGGAEAVGGGAAEAAAAGGAAEAAAEDGAAAEGVWYAVGRRGGGNSELVG